MSFISQEQILKVLIGFNPWWATGQVSDSFLKPVKRLAFYEARKIYHHPSIRREVILSGARRVGKTTIMYQMINDLLKNKKRTAKQVVYVSFDHPLLKLSSIDRILDAFKQNISFDYEELFLFFDEIQYANDWNTWLKTLYDQFPQYKIMATGSASPLLAAKASESGVGRWTTIKIPTLSFYEYIDLMEIDKPSLPSGIKPTSLSAWTKEQLSSLMAELQPLQKHFHQYLLLGGFPEVAMSKDIPFAQRMIREDVVDKVLKRDMTSLFGIRNVAELEKIFVYLCMRSGNIIEQNTIAKEIGVSRPTVSNYMELLEQANLIYKSDPTELGGKKVLKAKSKIYLADAAIRNAVLMLGEEVLTDSEEMGMIIETTVYKHVHAFYYEQLPHVGYYRDAKTDKEIDIVVSFPRFRILIEVKYRENTVISEKESIVEWANDPRSWGAVVITKQYEDYGMVSHPTKTPIVKIPAFAFLYLLGHAEHEAYVG